MNVNETMVKNLYERIRNVETESYKTSVSVKDLRAMSKRTTIGQLLKQIDEENEDVMATNMCILADAFRDAWSGLVCLQSEKRCFLRVLARVREATDNFRITFQEETTDETIGNSESGLTPYRKTTATAAGLRTCFNSLAIFDNEVSRKAKQQANETALNDAAAKLAASLNIDASLVTPELLRSLGLTRVTKVG